jgi:hypothetical protein
MRLQAVLLLTLAYLPLACTKTETNDEEAGEESSSSTSNGETTTSAGGDTTETGDCTPGAFNCECDENMMCAPMLECIDGMCVFDDGCTPGQNGCECNNGMCEAGLACVDGICGPPPCTPGSAGCSCDGGACDEGLECIDGACWGVSPYPDCGWDAGNGWNACGQTIEDPAHPVMCPDEAALVAGEPCPAGLDIIGCCDSNGDNWWCEGGAIAFDDCAGGGGETDTGSSSDTSSSSDTGSSSDSSST